MGFVLRYGSNKCSLNWYDCYVNTFRIDCIHFVASDVLFDVRLKLCIVLRIDPRTIECRIFSLSLFSLESISIWVFYLQRGRWKLHLLFPAYLLRHVPTTLTHIWSRVSVCRFVCLRNKKSSNFIWEWNDLIWWNLSLPLGRLMRIDTLFCLLSTMLLGFGSSDLHGCSS